MKRYLIFAAIGPLLGGFWLLLTTTVMSGYWGQGPDAAEIGKLLKAFFTTLPYSYLFGFLPSLMIGAVDDILFHLKRISPALRIVLVGLVGFCLAELLYGSRGQDSGAFQFVMYGLVGFIPAVVSAFLVHRLVEETPAAAAEPATAAEPAHDNGGQNVPAA
jgi:hypothetical protein